MKDQLPPLNPLRIFYFAAKSASFTDAARQLSVTQAAVSRQISTLEDFLGLKLFNREQRAPILTAVGRSLYREIAPAFDSIINATADMLRYRNPNIVYIQSYPTLIARKLVPGLDKLLGSHPSLEVSFLNAVRREEFSLDRADIVLRVSDSPSGDLKSFPFARDEIAPAAVPSIADAAGGRFDDLPKSVPLLATKFRHSDWSEWAEFAGVSIADRRIINFDSSELAFQAAFHGVGVCMAQCSLMSSDIAADRLRCLSKKHLVRPSIYWCIASPRRRMTRQIRNVLDWLETLKDPRL